MNSLRQRARLIHHLKVRERHILSIISELPFFQLLQEAEMLSSLGGWVSYLINEVLMQLPDVPGRFASEN
jgi:hypothetical protein